MFEKVLVPLDGSTTAEIVLPYLYKLHEKFNFQLAFLHVCHSHEIESNMSKRYVEHIAETTEKRLKLKQGSIETVIVAGNTAEQILEEAQKLSSDLILMASHGHSGAGIWMLGSVVHKVLTASTLQIPILVVRGEFPGAPDWPQSAIVPLDGSPLSESILPFVIAVAGVGVTTTLLRICEPPDLLADYPASTMPETWEAHVKLARQGAENTCNTYLGDIISTKLGKEGIKVDSKVILADRATDGILEYAGQDPFALIIMSTHGQSGFSHWPYGHVADRILLASKNPILMVHPHK